MYGYQSKAPSHIKIGAAMNFIGDSMSSFDRETSRGSIIWFKACSEIHVCIKVHDMTKYRRNSTNHIDTNKYVIT